MYTSKFRQVSPPTADVLFRESQISLENPKFLMPMSVFLLILTSSDSNFDSNVSSAAPSHVLSPFASSDSRYEAAGVLQAKQTTSRRLTDDRKRAKLEVNSEIQSLLPAQDVSAAPALSQSSLSMQRQC